MHDAHESGPDWQIIDRTLVDLARRQGELDREIGPWLALAQRERVHRKLGYGSFEEYVTRRFGYDPRMAREKVRVARALETLPQLATLLKTGARSWSTVRELVRVARPETEAAWLAETERMTVRQVELMVAGRKPGDLPTDTKDPLLERRRVVFELEPEEYALWLDASERLRGTVGPSATSRDVFRALVEQALGRRPDAEPGYQVALTVCASCDRTWQQAGSQAVEVSPALGECAQCDGELVGFTRIDEGVVEESVTHVGQGSEAGPMAHVGHEVGFGPSTHVGHASEPEPPTHMGREDRGLRPTDPGRASEPEPPTHVGHEDPEAQLAEATWRIVQTQGSRGLVRAATRLFGGPLRGVTPRLRALARTRDGRRCVVPGCTHFRFVDLHHTHFRARGGRDELDNLVCLCTQHHRAVHEGVLAIEGTPSTGLVFRHAGGQLYGSATAPAH